MGKVKFTFILGSRYPSEKAYAVTTGNTALALTSLGYEVQLHGVGTAQRDSFGNLVCGHQGLLTSALRVVAASRIPGVSNLAYHFVCIIMALVCYREERRKPFKQTYWLREPVIATVLSLVARNSRIVLELHHRPRWVSSALVRRLIKKGKTTILTITMLDYIDLTRKYDSRAIFFAPMSVPAEFLNKPRSQEENNFSIVFTGKGFSNGHDNNLNILIDALKYLQEIKNVRLVFIGLEPSYREKLNGYSQKLKVQPGMIIYISHVSHNQIPEFLSKYSVSVVPYPESEYNQSRSPLKIIESAACRIPLIVSHTKAHQDLIDSDLVTSFTDGDAESLASSILKIYHGDPEIQERTNKAFSFAKECTYDFRAKSVIEGMQVNSM